MAELPRFFVTQPTPRVGPSRTARTTAPLARLSPADFAAPGQAAAGIGQAVAGLGQVIQQIDQRFAAARDILTSQEALTSFRISLQQIESEQLALNNIPDADAAIGIMEAQRDQDMEGMNPNAQARFRRLADEHMLASAARLRTEGRQRILARGKATIVAGREELSRDLIGKNAAQSIERIDKFMSDFGVFEVAGIVSPGTLMAQAEQARNDAIQFDMRIEPITMLQRLKDPEDLVHLSLEQRTKFIDIAQTEANQKLESEEKAQKQSDLNHKKVQKKNAAVHRATYETPTASVRELQEQKAQINREAVSGGIDGPFQREANAAIDRIVLLQQSPVVKEDETVKRDIGIAIELARTPSDFARVRQDLLSSDGLSATTVPAFLRRISNRMEATHFTARTAYQSGVRTILGAAFPAGIVDVQMERLTSATKKKLFNALELYRQTMQGFAGTPEGFVAVDREARKQALAIRDSYFPIGMKLRDVPAIPKILDIRTLIPSATEGGLPTSGPIDVPAAITKLGGLNLPDNLKATFFEALEEEEKRQRVDLELKKAKDQEAAEEALRETPGWFQSFQDKWFPSHGGKD